MPLLYHEPNQLLYCFLCRNLLGCSKYLSKLRNMEMPEVPEQLYGIKVCVCKVSEVLSSCPFACFSWNVVAFIPRIIYNHGQEQRIESP